MSSKPLHGRLYGLVRKVQDWRIGGLSCGLLFRHLSLLAMKGERAHTAILLKYPKRPPISGLGSGSGLQRFK